MLEVVQSEGKIEDRLVFGVPKKGRLYDNCLELLHKIGLKFSRKPRHDLALVSNLPILLVFLPASDIPKYVAEGDVDMGITGLDFIAETQVEDKVTKLLELGFGNCRLQVAVPKAMMQPGGAELVPQEAADAVLRRLVSGRVVTSFPELTRQYFARLEGCAPSEISTKIINVSGSVEAACGLGLADAIVDLVDSGETLKAVGLVPIDTVLTTQSLLISNRNSSKTQLINRIKQRVQGAVDANKYVLCQYNIERKHVDAAILITPGKKSPSVMPLDQRDWVSINVMVEKAELANILDSLTAIGATDILVISLENCRV